LVAATFVDDLPPLMLARSASIMFMTLLGESFRRETMGTPFFFCSSSSCSALILELVGVETPQFLFQDVLARSSLCALHPGSIRPIILPQIDLVRVS
jgi:hypothetical protein